MINVSERSLCSDKAEYSSRVGPRILELLFPNSPHLCYDSATIGLLPCIIIIDCKLGLVIYYYIKLVNPFPF